MKNTTAFPRRRRRRGMSIQSILLIMLLVVSVTSNVVVGAIGYINGTESLRDSAIDKVVEVRDSRARELRSLFDVIENSMLVHSRGESLRGAAEAFNVAFDELQEAEFTDEQSAEVDQWYATVFGPALADALGTTVDVASFLPTGTAERYLAYHYTIPFTEFGEAIAVNDAGDGSSWSEAHALNHDYFERMTRLLHYEDALLIDTDGNVVYSANKGVDLGSNLLTGPYALTNVAEAYRSAMNGRLLDSVTFTDFESYQPSLATPAAWAVSLIARDGEVIGAFAVEMPVARIDFVMTGGGNWAGGGLGRTGETYIVGRDELMRSPSRKLLEDPALYEEQAIALGVERGQVDRVLAAGATMLVQPARTEAVGLALLGGSGSVVSNGYLGGETIAAYAPLDVENLGWVIIAEVDTAEAFAPVQSFTANLIVSSAIIVLLISILSLIIAQFLVRPLRRLGEAATRIGAGESGIEVDAGSTHELSSLATAFNEMSRSLAVKADLLEEQQAENDRLLLSLMPEALVQRYREGARAIAQDHREVTVLFADIVGLEEYTDNLESEAALDLLNELVRRFDEAADELGVERVRTTRHGYLASCGLSVPRIDSARRTVEFAFELQAILRRFSGETGADLNLRAGIDTGAVTSGLVGRSHVIFDLWGDAVNLAFRLRDDHREAGIFVTERVLESIPDTIRFEEATSVQTDGGIQRAWRLHGDVPVG